MAVPIGSLPKRLVVDGSEQIPIQSSGRQTQYILVDDLRGFVAGSFLYASSITAVGTAADLLEANLVNQTITGNDFITTRYKMKVYAFGDFGANGDTKRAKVKVDGTTLADTGIAVFNGSWWEVELVIKVVDTANVTMEGHFVAIDGATGARAYYPIQAAQAVDLTNDWIVAITGQNGAATANDVRMKSYDVKIETI